VLRHQAACPIPAANAGHPISFGEVFFGREALAHLGPCLDGGVEENLVECAPARAITGGDTVKHQLAAHHTEIPGIKGNRRRGRAAGGDDAVEQAPVAQASRALPTDEVAMRDVARKCGPIQQQDLVALSREQHCRRRSRAPRADHDDIVPPVHCRPLRACCIGQPSAPRFRKKRTLADHNWAAASLPNRSAKLHTQRVFDWNDLKLFLAFARNGSTLAAAKALGVNQSTVHRRLAALEECLGRRLVERHLTGYRLTALGEELRPYAERVEEAAAAFERHLASCDQELTGKIRVTCPAAVADRLARTPLIDAFHARYPDLRVELVMSERFLDLAKGEADIAIRAGKSPDDALVGRKIAEGRWGVYASRSYVERHGRPERQEDIERHLVVAFDGAIAHYPAAQWLRSIAPNATVAARSDNWPGFVLAV